MKEVSIDQIKAQAKLLKKELKIKHSKALELISQQHGYRHWNHLIGTYKKRLDNDTDRDTKPITTKRDRQKSSQKRVRAEVN